MSDFDPTALSVFNNILKRMENHAASIAEKIIDALEMSSCTESFSLNSENHIHGMVFYKGFIDEKNNLLKEMIVSHFPDWEIVISESQEMQNSYETPIHFYSKNPVEYENQ